MIDEVTGSISVCSDKKYSMHFYYMNNDIISLIIILKTISCIQVTRATLFEKEGLTANKFTLLL
ncbi:MAG TPA: hypothetical protein PLH80_11260, partial [Spirochaetota bacterium]|nr:hypothetical protein [Spirochaetota bacterium]HQI39130.1 hypothetical protein [Spirochaetota bacterium]